MSVPLVYEGVTNDVVFETRGELDFVIDTAQPVMVQTGAGVGLWVAVEGGVQPGQRVIVRGNERLMPGQKVAGEPQEYELP